ncbi:hypothetical protein EDB85DRAFT_1895784 [Lactarius pseudohatsudake]|nr:hypothetical protein EDB85DRAFT_1895784 [Lactarius pseudohatsudake]
MFRNLLKSWKKLSKSWEKLGKIKKDKSAVNMLKSALPKPKYDRKLQIENCEEGVKWGKCRRGVNGWKRAADARQRTEVHWRWQRSALRVQTSVSEKGNNTSDAIDEAEGKGMMDWRWSILHEGSPGFAGIQQMSEILPPMTALCAEETPAGVIAERVDVKVSFLWFGTNYEPLNQGQARDRGEAMEREGVQQVRIPRRARLVAHKMTTQKTTVKIVRKSASTNFAMITRGCSKVQSHEPEKNRDWTGLQLMATGPSVAGRLGLVSTGLYTNTTPTRKTQVLHQQHRPSPSPTTTTTTTSIPTPGPATRTGINDDKRVDTNSGPAIKTTINHDHFKSSTTPTATTPTPTTPTTRQWPRQDLRRPQRLRRHDDHREPATLDRHQQEQPRQHQRLRPTTNDHHHSNFNSHNDSDNTITTTTTTRATFSHNNDTLNNDDTTTTATATRRQLQKQHVDNRDDDCDDDEKGEGGLALRDDGDSDGGSRSCGYSSITILSLCLLDARPSLAYVVYFQKLVTKVEKVKRNYPSPLDIDGEGRQGLGGKTIVASAVHGTGGAIDMVLKESTERKLTRRGMGVDWDWVVDWWLPVSESLSILMWKGVTKVEETTGLVLQESQTFRIIEIGYLWHVASDPLAVVLRDVALEELPLNKVLEVFVGKIDAELVKRVGARSEVL